MDRLRDDVIVRTATSYLELAKVRHSLELMRSEQASAEKILEVTRERVAANQELPIEVTRSQLTLARAAGTDRQAGGPRRNSLPADPRSHRYSGRRSRSRSRRKSRRSRVDQQESRNGESGHRRTTAESRKPRTSVPRASTFCRARRLSYWPTCRHRRPIQHPQQVQ